MAIQIINCPSCGTFLLEDTAECHTCGHVLNAVVAETTKRESLPSDQAVDDDMDICSNCGESCRKGLVRCWNCGSFTRPEIAEAHRQRSEMAATEMDNHFDLPVLDATSVTETDSMTRRALSTPESILDAPPMAREEHDGSDDFELSEEIQLSEADDSSFDLADEIQLRNEGTEDFESAPVFALQQTEPAYSVPYAPPVTSPADEIPRLAASLTKTPVEISTIPLQSIPVNEPPNELTTIPLLGDSPTAAPADGGPIPPIAPVESAAAGEQNGKTALSPEDELLKIASDEEAEISKLRKDIRFKDTFVVFCPQGHRIRVRERFRGKTGKCPKCQSEFIVPLKQSPKPKKRTDVEFATVGGDSTAIVGRYTRWLTDVHLHTVVPEKLKLKADSLLNDFQTVDVGFGNSEILIVVLVVAGGFFGASAKKKPAARTAMLEYFSKPDAVPDGLAAAYKRVVGKEFLPQMVLAQPAPVGTESLFGDIPIFGTGRIAIRLPRTADEKGTQYLSFSLSEFRVFSYAMQAVCSLEGFGANAEIPLTDQYDTFKCHYNETPVLALRQIDYYQKDPNLKLEINGWKCSTCGLIVGEEGRKKEKIGGLDGKGIAKAKCPKCKQKFGNNPLYKVPDQATAAVRAPVEAPVEAQSVTQVPAANEV